MLLLNKLTSLATGKKFTDSQSGLRAYSRRAIQSLAITEQGIGVDSQILIDAHSKGLSVVEAPARVTYRKGSSTYNFMRHGLEVAFSIFRVVVERRPLLVSIPGVFAMIIGVALFIHLLNLYNSFGYFSLPFALLASVSVLAGLILAIAALILYAIRRTSERLAHQPSTILKGLLVPGYSPMAVAPLQH